MKTSADANKAYALKLKDVRLLVRTLEKQIDRHEVRQSAHLGDWGFLGDMQEAEERLSDVIRFLGGDKRMAGRTDPLDAVMAMRSDTLVSREDVAKLCSDCADKMARKGMVAVRAGVIKAALLDAEVKTAVRTRQKGRMKVPNVTVGTP